MTEHVDVLIIGAGVSGIGAAHRLRTQFPDRTFLMLEAQEARGGTWWTHQYPGARSDSDLFTYGYRHKPWRGKSIAAGGAIMEYLDEVIDEDGFADRIRYHHRVTALSWSSGENRWTADVERTDTGERLQVTATFLWMCQGYYNHDDPYTPEWPGTERFEGTIVHTQAFPADLDYEGKKVLVIGSGATAATVVPAMARSASHVTMLQRSPSYWFPSPTTHELAAMLEPLDLPDEWTHEILRRQYITQYDWLASASRDTPAEAHEFLMETIKPLLPEGTDVERHFTPSYRPWQQRIVIVPDGDFFESMRDGTVSVVTDTISEFTEKGVQISSGEVLEADVIVTATGFNLAVLGDIPFTVDGEAVDFSQRVTWRGLMISGVPNMAYAFGYFRHSWTLRVDLVNDVVERIFGRMAERGASVVEPQLRPGDEDMPLLPWVAEDNFNAGYVMRGRDKMFRQGDRDPWTHMHEHDHERAVLPEADLDDGLTYR
ncbi:flavin-containing monooxygenase [Pseudonocardia endophytica]|uniref:Cation diffusion facilitator CzcD-associated flavoprotein CzcO n=1 Tax=Pseudonocardia endophytica TaxID=401976 RepID=A0A4V2PIG6_PSEEN|nr:NAD(P)/FAD-dependent oxidoreductase [Pseudonocardia endophytica]TCK24546.1 cation diffusion facilitator CzcD-associated flavoprotein CzcO [Pseudonocardia endophytica]